MSEHRCPSKSKWIKTKGSTFNSMVVRMNLDVRNLEDWPLTRMIVSTDSFTWLTVVPTANARRAERTSSDQRLEIAMVRGEQKMGA